MRLNRKINFYIAVLIITVVGSLATFTIVNVSLTADGGSYWMPSDAGYLP